ncbi:hypothetical protein, partial [Okeania sp. SIO2G5]|uniref:hypothetical protein n=1 Tax=Okeania sp. SIO2G5 TaxID=2607796 RepID=UPI0013C134AB
MKNDSRECDRCGGVVRAIAGWWGCGGDRWLVVRLWRRSLFVRAIAVDGEVRGDGWLMGFVKGDRV